MTVEPEFILFVAAAVLTLAIAVVAFIGIRRILRDERDHPPGDGA
jgi:hypothetical protein